MHAETTPHKPPSCQAAVGAIIAAAAEQAERAVVMSNAVARTVERADPQDTADA